MARKSLNQVLGERLAALMSARNLSASQLGRKANVAANTVGNYLKAAREAEVITSGDRGKERSAKLAELERIADALQINPLDLLTDPGEEPTPGETLGRMFDALPVAAEKRMQLYAMLMARLAEHQPAPTAALQEVQAAARKKPGLPPAPVPPSPPAKTRARPSTRSASEPTEALLKARE